LSTTQPQLTISRETIVLVAVGLVDLSLTLLLVNRFNALEANPLMGFFLRRGVWSFDAEGGDRRIRADVGMGGLRAGSRDGHGHARPGRTCLEETKPRDSLSNPRKVVPGRYLPGTTFSATDVVPRAYGMEGQHRFT
jgi:hypothetical protein